MGVDAETLRLLLFVRRQGCRYSFTDRRNCNEQGFTPNDIDAQYKDGILTLTIDLKKRLRPSASGKTTIVATSAGNQAIAGGGGVIIGVNAYVKG